MNLKLFLLLLLFINCCFGQSLKEIDSINATPHNTLVKNLDASEKLFTENLAAAKAMNYAKGVAVAKTRLAMVYFYLKEADKAMKLTYEATVYFEEVNDWMNAAIAYSDIGFEFKATNIDQGLSYFRKAIALIEPHPPGAHTEKIYNNYGVLQTYKEPKALDSALHYHKKAYQVALDLNLTAAIPYDLNNIALVYSAMGDYEKAFLALDKSDVYRKKENNELNWADNLAYRADIYFDKGSNDSAIYYYEEALKLAESSQFTNLSKYCLERLSLIYERNNNATKSLQYYKKLQQLKDSVYTFETNIAIAELQEEYDATTKEKKIIAQEKLVNEQYTQILILSLILLLLLIVVYAIYHNNKNKQQQLKQDLILEKANALNQVQKEKLRISRDLHDNIGSQLTYVISSLDNLNYVKDDGQKREKLQNLEKFTKNTLTELRDTIWTIEGTAVSYDELMTRIQDYVLKLKSNYPEKQFTVQTINSEANLTAEMARNYYRTIQEGINNCLKHANASKIDLAFTKNKITIQDNGIGFNLQTVKRGNGLDNMTARIEEIGGTLIFKTATDLGTLIEINLGITLNT